MGRICDSSSDLAVFANFWFGAVMNADATTILEHGFGGYMSFFLLAVYLGVEWISPRLAYI